MSMRRSRKCLLGLFCMLLAGLALGVMATAGGYWADVAGYNCPSGQVCADWFEDGSYAGAPCCIPSEKLGSSEPDACTGAEPVREREREIY